MPDDVATEPVPLIDLFVDTTEIAHRLNVKPGTVHQWRQRHTDFPAPILELAIGPIWDWLTVKQWASSRSHATGPGRSDA